MNGIYPKQILLTNSTNYSNVTIILNNASKHTEGNYSCSVVRNYTNNTISTGNSEQNLTKTELSYVWDVKYYNQSFISFFDVSSNGIRYKSAFFVDCYYKLLPIDSFISLSITKDDQQFYIQHTDGTL
jgi:hypothetical protein